MILFVDLNTFQKEVLNQVIVEKNQKIQKISNSVSEKIEENNEL